jgi:hypothetical protein
MAWYGDVRFKQLAVVEFIVAKKESVTEYSQAVNNVYGVRAADKSAGSGWSSRISSSDDDRAQFSDARRSGQLTRAVTQGLLQRAHELI